MFIFDRLDTLIDREPFIFIGWGGLIPQGILFTDGNLQNNLITLGLLIDRSTLPVRPVCCCRINYSVWPVRPLGRTGQTGRYCLMPILVINICPLFFGKTCVPNNTLLDQNCLKAMNTSAIFFLRAITIYRPYLVSSSSWWRNNLLRPPYLLHDRRPRWYNLRILFHGLLFAHPLQPSLLGVRQAWETLPRL